MKQTLTVLCQAVHSDQKVESSHTKIDKNFANNILKAKAKSMFSIDLKCTCLGLQKKDKWIYELKSKAKALCDCNCKVDTTVLKIDSFFL